MFIFVLIALLRAQLTTDKRAGCQKGERWQPGKASRRARCFLPSRDTLPLGERGTRFASPGGQEGGSHSSPPFPPPAKSRHTDPIAYLERVTIHFAVLRIHVAEAAMPTQGGPSVAAGEAFCPCCSCQSSEQRYLKWSEQGKAIPFPPVPQFPPLDTVPKGRSPYTPPPTHPWHTDKPLHAGRPLQVPPRHVAAFQHIVSICAQRGRAACFELTAFLLPIDISRRFHFCTSTRRLWFSQPPRPFPPPRACPASGGFPIGARFHVTRDQIFSRIRSSDAGHKPGRAGTQLST